MIGLVLAAATATAPAPAPKAERMPNLYQPPARCGTLHEDVVRHIQTATGGRPPAVIYAVNRMIDGCPVPAPIGFRQDYLLPGAADVQAKPEGAPTNRR